MGRIERGGGDGGEPARSPPGRPRFRRLRDRTCGCDNCRRADGKRVSARLLQRTTFLHAAFTYRRKPKKMRRISIERAELLG